MKTIKLRFALAGLFFASLLPTGFAAEEKPEGDDPFAVQEPAVEKPRGEAPLPKKTTADFTIEPVGGSEPIQEKGDFPRIEMPLRFNRYFDTPRIWRTAGGYLASFDAGEFGGAIFSATEGDKEWTLVLNEAHVQDMEPFGDGRYLAAGGLMHGNSIAGAAYILELNPKGEWTSRKVFESHLGVPRIVGVAATDIFLKAKAERLIVFTLDTLKSVDIRSVFGVTAEAAVHYLGEVQTEEKK